VCGVWGVVEVCRVGEVCGVVGVCRVAGVRRVAEVCRVGKVSEVCCVAPSGGAPWPRCGRCVAEVSELWCARGVRGVP